ncbi:MAG TPA: ABC-2 transporter permease [Clostridiales bacterium]|nr:ABC-2 transporter permease [Clostridiales bacterium]HQP69204.1 ABC-2 transporter permease [Clostridiales bacterium]
MKHIIKSNLYLIFWADKYFGAAVLAMLVAPVMILQGHFSAYAIGLPLSVFFSLLKLNSTVMSGKYERINVTVPVEKKDIVNARFLTAAIITDLFTIAAIGVSVWANIKEVIYGSKRAHDALPEIALNISTPVSGIIAGLIFGILLSVIISAAYIYCWSKYEHDSYNLYFTMTVLIIVFALKPLLQGFTDSGISMIWINLIMLLIALPAVFISLSKSMEVFGKREF